MIYNLKRTYKTDLSDDELLIFDVLFDSKVEVNALIGGEDFETNFNCPSHELEIIDLGRAINNFVKNGLVRLYLAERINGKTFSTYVELTEDGGGFWEKERRPDWDKFVADLSSDEKGFWEVRVFSSTVDTAKKFIMTAHACGLYELEDVNSLMVHKVALSERVAIVPWKKFENAYWVTSKISRKSNDSGKREIDWELYREKIDWWRSVEELMEYQNKRVKS